jgi:hypothetical protein
VQSIDDEVGGLGDVVAVGPGVDQQVKVGTELRVIQLARRLAAAFLAVRPTGLTRPISDTRHQGTASAHHGHPPTNAITADHKASPIVASVLPQAAPESVVGMGIGTLGCSPHHQVDRARCRADTGVTEARWAEGVSPVPEARWAEGVSPVPVRTDGSRASRCRRSPALDHYRDRRGEAPTPITAGTIGPSDHVSHADQHFVGGVVVLIG